MGCISQEFGHAFPSVVIAERARLPVGLLDTLLEYRRYAEAKALRDQTDDPRTLPPTPLLQLVEEIEFDLAAEEIANRA